MKVLVVGSLNVDLVSNVSRVPHMGETIYGDGFSINCGGKGANQAIAASKIGAETALIGSVGNDIFGERLISNLKNCNVETRGIKKIDGSSGIAVITVCDGDNCIIINPGANGETDCGLIDDNTELIEWADIVIMQFEIDMDVVLYTARKAADAGKRVVINPSPICEIPPELFMYTDTMVLNEYEAEILCGWKINKDTVCDAVRKINEMGCRQVIITTGSTGGAFNDGKNIKTFNAYKAKAVDTTAAGDSFMASFCVAEASGKSVEEAVDFAASVASIVVSRKGAAESIPDKTEIEHLL